MKSESKPVVLLILDGFGYSESSESDAIKVANTPTWDALWSHYPHTLIGCSGEAVGLPDGQMGNSEVGHVHLGAGRLMPQDFTRINNEIKSGDFFSNPVLCEAVDAAIETGGALHLFGLLSPGGVHSHDDHILAMVELAAKRGLRKIYLHAFLDGRDTPPKSAKAVLEKVEDTFSELGCGKIASLVGRFYAMDRDNRWERVQVAYELIVNGKGAFEAESALQGLQQAYARDETDEFVLPTAIVGEEGAVTLNDGDAVVFMNFRSDRAREMTRAINDKDFEGFARGRVPQLSTFVTLTEYQQDFDFPIAYGPMSVENGLGEFLSKQGKKQLRIAETEKFAHVTFFFNGGVDAPFKGEERILIPSPNVKTYDLQPEMSAPEVTQNIVEAIESGQFDVIISNYANCDMVGHTGNFDAAVLAVEAVDQALSEITVALEKVGGELLITADHGNIEQMVDPESGQPFTAHTISPVPLLYFGRKATLREGGSLIDVAPTLLELVGLETPQEMTGHSLIKR